jgi:hypothetical protein
MAKSMFSLAGTLEVVWHTLGWGIPIVFGALWSWILIATRQRAKAEQNLQDWSLKSRTSKLSRLNAPSLPPEPAAKTNSAILSSTPRPAVDRQGS